MLAQSCRRNRRLFNLAQPQWRCTALEIRLDSTGRPGYNHNCKSRACWATDARIVRTIRTCNSTPEFRLTRYARWLGNHSAIWKSFTEPASSRLLTGPRTEGLG